MDLYIETESILLRKNVQNVNERIFYSQFANDDD